MPSKKAQSGMEFVILIGFVLVSFTIFFLIIQGNLSDKISERQDKRIKEIALTVKNEINLAFHSSDGYRREFKIPKDVYGKDYNIAINESILFVETTDGKHAIAFSVREISGQIEKYDNVMTKEHWAVELSVE